jgi:hypothetical protein
MQPYKTGVYNHPLLNWIEYFTRFGINNMRRPGCSGESMVNAVIIPTLYGI